MDRDRRFDPQQTCTALFTHFWDSTLGGTDFWKTNEWLLGLVSLLTSCFAISIVPFTRRDMGERYFGWLNLYFGYMLLSAFMFFGGILSMFTRQGSPRLMTLFWWAFIGLSLYRRYEIWKKNNSGVEWHSMSIGTSLLPLPYSQEKIFKFFEPLTVFLVGAFFWRFSGQVGLWLMVGGVSLLINNHIVFHQERQSILDLRDGQIEAKFMSDALAGKPARQTSGFVVAESSIKLIGGDARLVQAFDKLSTDLKSILDAPPDLGGGHTTEQ
jgi:hypothetical protein